jgi:pyrroline-5-carboxylate reductase
LINKKIGFIGFGKMAEAIWLGININSLVSANDVYFAEKSIERQEEIQNKYNIRAFDIDTVFDDCDLIIFCVKPQSIKDILISLPKDNDLNNKIFISILAGVKTSVFQEYLGDGVQFVRVMPNTPAIVGKGVSALSFNTNISNNNKDIVRDIFTCFGEIVEVEEGLLDTVTGISGSGPAFLYRIAENIAQAGVQEGLSYEVALKLIAQTLVGAGSMILDSGKTTSELIKDVSSPNGTTVAGLNAFDNSSMDSEIKDIVRAAITRSKDISKSL